ncbi:hypothetical protein WN943_004139 [Citrus x changshan-huyou]
MDFNNPDESGFRFLASCSQQPSRFAVKQSSSQASVLSFLQPTAFAICHRQNSEAWARCSLPSSVATRTLGFVHDRRNLGFLHLQTTIRFATVVRRSLGFAVRHRHISQAR